MNNKEKLIQLVKTAEQVLKYDREHYTEGNILAISRLVAQAKLVINGDYRIPYVRNREFYVPREDEDILFIIKRYTKAPSYFMTDYGLEPALEWFLSTKEDKGIVREKNEKRLENHGALPKFDGNIFFKDAKRFKKNVLSDKILKNEFENIKKLADSYTKEQIDFIHLFMEDKIEYEKLNKHFYIWSKTDKIITFVSPKNARYAKLKFVLPSIENEEQGNGHIWIDDVLVSPANGADWEIENSGFEDNCNHWEPFANRGTPVIRWENQKPYCGKDNGSIYIENKTPQDEGGFYYGEDIKINGDVNHTISFFAKIDGKFKQGLKIIIEFFDENKNKIDEFISYFNRKSCLATVDFALTAQADAISYFFTGNDDYAEKAKKELLFILNDFCQGIEHWLVTGARPQGSDAYGAVQGGRILCSFASAYTFIKHKLNKDELTKMISLLEYFVDYLLDLRDRCELTPFQAQADASNWQTDMSAGIGFLMMAMPEFPNSKQWLLNANMILRSQLSCNVSEDGSWPESIRYHFAALGRFAIYAKVLKNCTGEDWFLDGPLAKMFRYPMMVQTPPYKFFDNKICTPNFGDHKLGDGQEFSILGTYCGTIYENDQELGKMLYKTWDNVGKPMSTYNGEAVVMANLFGDYSYFNNEIPQITLTSTDEFKQAGIFIFRNKGTYLALMASPKKIGHGHYDEGSFILYKENVPVIVDLGIEGYFDSTKDWYVSSSAHAVLQFARKEGKKTIADEFSIHLEKTDFSALEGWNDTPRNARLIDFQTSDLVDEISIEIENIEGGIHTRNVSYQKDKEIIIINDKVRAFDGEIRVSIPVAGYDSVINQNTVITKCHYGLSIETTFVGDNLKISIEKGRCLKMFPTKTTPTVDIIRVIGKCEITTIIR